jgi:hypothetical protein
MQKELGSHSSLANDPVIVTLRKVAEFKSVEVKGEAVLQRIVRNEIILSSYSSIASLAPRGQASLTQNFHHRYLAQQPGN